jgi:hypothetical protein
MVPPLARRATGVSSRRARTRQVSFRKKVIWISGSPLGVAPTGMGMLSWSLLMPVASGTKMIIPSL